MAHDTDGPAAHDHLLSFEPLDNGGWCWHYVWNAYAQAGASTGMGSTPTALKGWEATSGKHPGDWHPPHGAAIWLGRRYDGNMDGDVFIAGAYDGDHAATDEPGWHQTGLTSIEARMNLCGREYLGWSDHVLDCPIIGAAAPEPEPEPIREDEDMPGIRIHFQQFTDGNQAYVVETATGFFIPDSNHLAALVKAYSVDLGKLPPLNEYDWNAVQQAKDYSNAGYPSGG